MDANLLRDCVILNRFAWDRTVDPTHSTSCCTWPGVTCTAAPSSRVVSLSLANQNIHGVIPSSIGDLSYLQSLNLSNNALSGPIPPSIGLLLNLRDIDLSNNSLIGRIPPFSLSSSNSNTTCALVGGGNSFTCHDGILPSKCVVPNVPYCTPTNTALQRPTSTSTTNLDPDFTDKFIDLSNKIVIMTLSVAAILTLIALVGMVRLIRQRRKLNAKLAADKATGWKAAIDAATAPAVVAVVTPAPFSAPATLAPVPEVV
ncbi:hypothetical protein BC828DRAFT_376085 [Blastocladiella britannica]|nr:hypothetical protein BC828DRAFT_376085 [Blastocladiella britannica]